MHMHRHGNRVVHRSNLLSLWNTCHLALLVTHTLSSLLVVTISVLLITTKACPDMDLENFLEQDAISAGLKPLLNICEPSSLFPSLSDDVFELVPADSNTVGRGQDADIQKDPPLQTTTAAPGPSDAGITEGNLLPQAMPGPQRDAQLAQLAQIKTHLQSVTRLFPNTIFIPGMKHMMDNALKDAWNQMAGSKRFLEQLRALETLLRPQCSRDRLKNLFFAGLPSGVHLNKWSSRLKSLRWHEVIAFMLELHPISEDLRRTWNAKTYRGVKTDAEGKGPSNGVNLKEVDATIRSHFFWTYCNLMLEVSHISEELSHWSEGCPFHGNKCSAVACSFKGCRGAELATGHHKWFTVIEHRGSSFRMMHYIASLSEADARKIMDDWLVATNRMRLELELKLSFWDVFPWKLFSINHPDPAVARINCKLLMDRWAAMSSSAQRTSHPMVRRFMDHTWAGIDTHFSSDAPSDPSDPPLCDAMEAFAHGQDLHALSDAYKAWSGALARSRVQERSTEGIHSRVHKIYLFAPAASAPYISLELKYPDIEKVCMNRPQA
jgi:hypothetical protein